VSYYIEGSVPLAEVAKVTKRTTAEVEAEAVELGLFLGTDWAGRVAVAEDDAHGLVGGSARRTREDEVAWRTHLDACETWTRRRDEAVRDAHDAVGADPRSGPEKHSAARDAATEAGRRFEAANPPPTFVPGVEDGVAVRRYSAPGGKPAGLLDKARDLLAGSPR